MVPRKGVTFRGYVIAVSRYYFNRNNHVPLFCTPRRFVVVWKTTQPTDFSIKLDKKVDTKRCVCTLLDLTVICKFCSFS
jgi:hypothetical protein